MSWIPTASLEFRHDESRDALVLYQKWTMRTHDGEVKFQWRPVRGQGAPLPLSGLIRANKIELEEFDPSD